MRTRIPVQPFARKLDHTTSECCDCWDGGHSASYFFRELLAEAERTVNEVADAVDGVPTGRIIRDSEDPARDALDRFRQIVYERVLQAKVDAAEAAFPPSGQLNDRQEEDK